MSHHPGMRKATREHRREMYAGGRPNAEARAIHRRYVDGPLPRLVPFACVLETVGRTSGKPVSVPLVTVRVRGAWYLVSMLGEPVLHGRRRAVHLVEVSAAERAPIIRRYLLFAPGARPHIDVPWYGSRRAFESIAADLPVFRIEPRVVVRADPGPTSGDAGADPDPGPLIASGRAADVFDRGDGTVLRRYRSDHDVATERRVMAWLAAEGVPVPRVHRGDGRDLVMDRIDGPTMLEDLQRRPWRVVAHARTLASLQRRLNEMRAPDWFPRRDGVPPGDGVLHLDLHPMNVIVGDDGPVVIDWTNASRGPGGFDAAMSCALMSAYEVDGLRDRIARLVFVELFRSVRGRRVVRRAWPDALTFRLRDPNVTSGERAALEAALDAAAHRRYFADRLINR
jgi:aminoglycoside phosphotransferase (APT) family kinase protein